VVPVFAVVLFVPDCLVLPDCVVPPDCLVVPDCEEPPLCALAISVAMKTALNVAGIICFIVCSCFNMFVS